MMQVIEILIIEDPLNDSFAFHMLDFVFLNVV